MFCMVAPFVSSSLFEGSSEPSRKGQRAERARLGAPTHTTHHASDVPPECRATARIGRIAERPRPPGGAEDARSTRRLPADAWSGPNAPYRRSANAFDRSPALAADEQPGTPQGMVAIGSRWLLTRQAFGALLDALRQDGFTLVGPRVRDGAIVHDRIGGIDDLPEGTGDEQRPGAYRLRARADRALFGFAVGPHSLRREMLVPRTTLVRIRKSATGLEIDTPAPPASRRAFIGVRACDLAAMAVQDRVLLGGPFADADYAARRRDVFVLAVQCTEPGGTCFCASMGTGPRARAGFDLAATELCDDGPHRFVVEVGTELGAAVLARVDAAQAPDADVARADARVDAAATRMGRSLDTAGLKEAIQASPEHPRWDDVAARCLGCTNCTLVCPTCFCTTVEDTTDLSGHEAERVRRWDSCFTADFAYVHGGNVRPSLRGRYRQWLTHKLASWWDQFDTSGCVGCGRCITWCPVGIDLTEEAAAVRAPANHRRPNHGGG
jgi:hypothetical protein